MKRIILLYFLILFFAACKNQPKEVAVVSNAPKVIQTTGFKDSLEEPEIVAAGKPKFERTADVLEEKNKVVEKNLIIENKQKEIIDSIQYARRIQNSLMPTEKYIDTQLKRLKRDDKKD